MRNLRRLFLAAIFMIGLVLRTIRINSREIQYDDALSFFLSQRSIAEIVYGTAADTMPPFYYLILHFWQVLSTELWFLRSLSVLFSIGALLFLFLIINKLFDLDTSYWAVFLTAISPLQIYHAQDIRMYSLLVFCQLGFLYYFVTLFMDQSDEGKDLKNWIGLILFGSASLYTHNLAVFIFIMPTIVVVLYRKWRLLKRLVLAQLISVLLFSPWLILLPGQIDKIQNAFWTPKPGIVEIIQTLLLTFSTLPLPGFWLGASLFVIILIFVFVAMNLYKHVKNQNVQIVLILALLPPLLLFIFSYLMRPLYVTRGFLTSTIFLYVLIAYAIAVEWKKTHGKLILALFVVCTLIGLPFLYNYNSFPRSPYREMINDLVKHGARDSVIVHDNKLSFFPCFYYSRNLNQVFIKDIPGSQNDTFALGSQVAMDIYPMNDIDQAVQDNDQVYFVYFEKTENEYQEKGFEKHPVHTELEQSYYLMNKLSYNDLNLVEYSTK